MHQGMSQLVVERNFEVTRGTFGNLAAVPRITLYIVYNIYIYIQEDLTMELPRQLLAVNIKAEKITQ